MPMPKKRKPLASKDSALRIWSRKFAFPTSSKLVRSQWSLRREAIQRNLCIELRCHRGKWLKNHEEVVCYLCAVPTFKTKPHLSQYFFLYKTVSPFPSQRKEHFSPHQIAFPSVPTYAMANKDSYIITKKSIAWISSLGYETIIPRINNDVIFFKKLCKFFNDCIGRFARWHQHNGFPWPLPGERWKHLPFIVENHYWRKKTYASM